MVLPHSGFDDIELVKIEHRDFSLVIKGKPFHERYEGLKQYRSMDYHDLMHFSVLGEGLEKAEVFDIETMQLSENSALRPIFFENGTYLVMIVPKTNQEVTFYHEHPLLRNAVTKTDLPMGSFLMGNLSFQNEVGLTSFEVRSYDKTLLRVTLEIFPTKLDYRKDYERLLDEVNEEIYNLAFHFIKKTYLQAGIKLDGTPSQAEFYQLVRKHFNQFIQAVIQIEQQPHHKLEQTYHRVRGDQLRKTDSTTRKYLQKRAHLWMDVQSGIPIHNRQLMPTEGIVGKKELRYDTFENRYIKWLMERLIDKLEDLVQAIYKQEKSWNKEPDADLLDRLNDMKSTLDKRMKNPFWRSIQRLDRNMNVSLVLQMAPGYRDAFQFYLMISKGLILRGNYYQMSVKDVALLYEYWTFIKLGQLLGEKYEQIDQDIVKVNRNGLFVNLDTNKTAKRTFLHPITGERIELVYQSYTGKLPTLSQKPDTMLSIQKKGKEYDYQYIFDAKYRVEYAQTGSYYEGKYHTPGPMEDDINTMHRYRDSIVAMNNGPYERTAFGAYVLFPWHDEKSYKHHAFYKSIGLVNIGGLPFLPNTTEMVEQFMERLIEKSPEELQKEGILPRGAEEEWKSSLVEKVLVGLVHDQLSYSDFIRSRSYSIPISSLKKGWQEAKYIALYLKDGVSNQKGIKEYGFINDVNIQDDYVVYSIDLWKELKHTIAPVRYGIGTSMITSFTQLKEARELPELYLKSREEMILWKMLRRVSDRIQIGLNHEEPDQASAIVDFSFKDIQVVLNQETQEITFIKNDYQEVVPWSKLNSQPTAVFKLILLLLEN